MATDEEEARRMIDIFESEGLGDAMAEVRAVLEGNGLQKNGQKGWTLKPYDYHMHKCMGHYLQDGREDESGKHHLAHCVSRALMMLQVELEAGE